MSSKKHLFWFANNLRISDNPGLHEASRDAEVLAVYIYDDKISQEFVGCASKCWLNQSLQSLNKTLKDTLNIYAGDTVSIIESLVKRYQITSVYANKSHSPLHIKAEKLLESRLNDLGVGYKSFNASLLWDPENVKKDDDTTYKVFTPFYQNGCLKNSPTPREPLRKPKNLNLIKDSSNRTLVNDLDLLPKISWDKKILKNQKIGEKAAQNQLYKFLENSLEDYKTKRDFPSKAHTSHLSAHLHFGEISPNQVWYAVKSAEVFKSAPAEDVNYFLREIAWREFSYYLLYHFPELPSKPFYKKYENFEWDYNKKYFSLWQKGITGYPIIDAGMRQLWQTGFMHNRIRLITGSFLVKNLLQPWQKGAQWFQECLLDFDLANNGMNWQWVAGCGVDAAPYFRIMNPILQAEKFDADADYIRKFVPELKKMPTKYIFKPWLAPSSVLKDSCVVLGKTYPNPIIDIKESRDKALKAFRAL